MTRQSLFLLLARSSLTQVITSLSDPGTIGGGCLPEDRRDIPFFTHWCVPVGRLQARLDGRRDVGRESSGGVSGRALCVAGEEEGAASGSCRVREAAQAQDRVTAVDGCILVELITFTICRRGKQHLTMCSIVLLLRTQGAGARGEAVVVGE